MKKEFQLFIKEKRYVQNVAKAAVLILRADLQGFQKHPAIKQISGIGKISLLEFVATIRKNDLSPEAAD